MEKSVRQALDYAIKKGFQIHPGVVGLLREVEARDLDKIIRDVVREKAVNRDYHIGLDDMMGYLGLDVDDSLRSDHAILFDCTAGITIPEGVEGYTSLFQSRFEKMKELMRERPVSGKVRSAASIKVGSDEEIYAWGLVADKRVDENSARLTIEDTSGVIEGVIMDENVMKEVGELFLDQFVMVRVDARRRIEFTEIMQPDVPGHKFNRSESETFAAFLSDLHVGSRFFMEGELRAFFRWLSGPDPYARRVRFVMIAGDVVDGVGIFADQDKELVQQTTQEQFEKATQLLRLIPPHIKVFVSPGNHDPGRRALPQPSIPKEDGPGLWGMENVYMVGNPAMVSINGVKVLMFHGQSIDDIVKTTRGMEYNNPAKIMKKIMKSRHLSPIYGSQTPIAPEREDLMVIDDIPDVFHAGHVHINEFDSHNGVLLINSGTWQAQTPFQESVGQVPTPCQAVLLNLKTFKLFVKQF